MFPNSYFPSGMFPPSYFPKGAAQVAARRGGITVGGRRRLIAQGLLYYEENKSVLDEIQKTVMRNHLRKLARRKQEFYAMMAHHDKVTAAATWTAVMAEV